MLSSVSVLLLLLMGPTPSAAQTDDPCGEFGNNYNCGFETATDWTVFEQSVEELASSLRKSKEPMTTVVRAVNAIKNENSTYANTIEKAAAAIATMTTTDPNTVGSCRRHG